MSIPTDLILEHWFRENPTAYEVVKGKTEEYRCIHLNDLLIENLEAHDELTRQNKIMKEALKYIGNYKQLPVDGYAEKWALIDALNLRIKHANEALKSCGGGDND